jgi:hypothetical protein
VHWGLRIRSRAETAQTIDDWHAVRREYEAITDELRDAPAWNPIPGNVATNRKRLLAQRYAC